MRHQLLIDFMTKLMHYCLPVLFLLSNTCNADAIVIVKVEYAPATMAKGKYAKQGYIDRITEEVQNNLPQYRFLEDFVPTKRLLEMAKSGKAYCFNALVNTPERRNFLNFTNPYGWVLPMGIVIRADDKDRFLPYLNKDEHINIEDLLKNKEIQFGISSGRTMGQMIDSHIKPIAAAGDKRVLEIYNDQATETLFKMLSYKRFHFTIASVSEMVYHHAPVGEFLFYQVEGNHKLMPVGFSCTKNKATEKVFSDLARTVDTERTHKIFQADYERWLPATMIKPYRKQLSELQKN